MKKISVIGDGGWGTALALLLQRKGHSVCLWSAFKEYADYLSSHRENKKFLPGVKIPDDIQIISDINTAVQFAEIIVFAVPSQYVRLVLKQFKEVDLSQKIMVSVCKGIEADTLKRMSEVIHDVLGSIPLVVLSGPTHAEEVALDLPCSVVASSKDLNLAETVQNIFIGPHFRVYTNSDMIGVELGGALKNVIAIAAGISDGLKLGDNAKAALVTRGITEMMRLGHAMGAKIETFAGLSGIGDLMTTCFSAHSRNRDLGEKLTKGITLDKHLSSTEMVAEGVKTTQSAYQLAKKFKVEMPIVEEVYSVLYEQKQPQVAIESLMSRKAKSEIVLN